METRRTRNHGTGRSTRRFGIRNLRCGPRSLPLIFPGKGFNPSPDTVGARGLPASWDRKAAGGVSLPARYDAIVIGGGHNGLTTAAYLARAGKRVLVLERRRVLGGAAVTEEVFPGFKFTVCSYVCSLLRPQVIRDLELPSHGFEVIPQESSFTPLPDGRYLYRHGHEEDAFQAIAKFSRRDAEAYPRFGRLMARLAKFIAPTLTMTPPDVGSLNPAELGKLLALNKQVKTLSEDELYTFARLMTMSAADYLDEWFETDALKAGLCSSGIIGTLLGPRSPGTAYVLMHHYMGEIDGAYRSWGYVRGGMGMVSESIAHAARSFGADIRVNADVRRILVKDGRTVGVELSTGERIEAKVIASGADPKRTFLKFLERSDLPADFVLHREVLSPWDLEQMIGLTGGNIFHGELTPDQLFFLRPTPGWAQYRTPIKGLYLCGSGAHPGGGVMGAPGLNAAREILKDWTLLRV